MRSEIFIADLASRWAMAFRQRSADSGRAASNLAHDAAGPAG